MFLSLVATGPEGTEFNGPLRLPIWDLAGGGRAGQIAYDLGGDLDGTPGLIFWNGGAWIKVSSGSTDTPNLQEVTDEGSTTTNSVTVSNPGDGLEAKLTTANNGAIVELNAYSLNVGPSTYISAANVLMQGDVINLTLQTGVNLEIVNDSGDEILTIFGSGVGTRDRNGVLNVSGTGNPEGVVQANPGSTFSRTDGPAGETFYVKQSGAGTSGWSPIA